MLVNNFSQEAILICMANLRVSASVQVDGMRQTMPILHDGSHFLNYIQGARADSHCAEISDICYRP
jgi:hypothetical protein